MREQSDRKTIGTSISITCLLPESLLWDTDYKIELVDIGNDTGSYRIVCRFVENPKKSTEMVKTAKLQKNDYIIPNYCETDNSKEENKHEK